MVPPAVPALGLVLALGLALPLAAAEKADPSWEKLRSLVGEWEGIVEGKPARVSYALVSNGTALMESMETEDATHMVTLYHPDGPGLLMTHYCAMGNQPRMRSKGLQDGRIDFTYVDATNLKASDADRMTRLVLTFPDAGHLVQEWTSKQGSREVVTRFEFARKK
jgi:hypothetical protein